MKSEPGPPMTLGGAAAARVCECFGSSSGASNAEETLTIVDPYFLFYLRSSNKLAEVGKHQGTTKPQKS
jgi:hypothetical protein